MGQQSITLQAKRSTRTAQGQHSTAQHSTAQHSTEKRDTAQHGTAQHSTAQHSTAQHSTAQRSIAQHSTDLEVLHPEQVQDHGVCEAELALKLGGFACHHLAHITLVWHLSPTTRPHYLVLTFQQNCLPSTCSMKITVAEDHCRVSLQSSTAECHRSSASQKTCSY